MRGLRKRRVTGGPTVALGVAALAALAVFGVLVGAGIMGSATTVSAAPALALTEVPLPEVSLTSNKAVLREETRSSEPVSEVLFTVAATGISSGSLAVSYTVGADRDDSTPNATNADYTVVASSGDTATKSGGVVNLDGDNNWTGTFRVRVVEDKITEDYPPEVFEVALADGDSYDVSASASSIAIPIVEGICDRTLAVCLALVHKLATDGIHATLRCDTVTASHLEALTGTLDLREGRPEGVSAPVGELTELKGDDFDDFLGITAINASGQKLSSLPGDIFVGLSNLTAVDFTNTHDRTFRVGAAVAETGLDGGEFRVMIVKGAPFKMRVHFTVTSDDGAGKVVSADSPSEGSVTSVTVEPGEKYSGRLKILGTPGQTVTATLTSAEFIDPLDDATTFASRSAGIEAGISRSGQKSSSRRIPDRVVKYSFLLNHGIGGPFHRFVEDDATVAGLYATISPPLEAGEDDVVLNVAQIPAVGQDFPSAPLGSFTFGSDGSDTGELTFTSDPDVLRENRVANVSARTTVKIKNDDTVEHVEESVAFVLLVKDGPVSTGVDGGVVFGDLVSPSGSHTITSTVYEGICDRTDEVQVAIKEKIFFGSSGATCTDPLITTASLNAIGPDPDRDLSLGDGYRIWIDLSGQRLTELKAGDFKDLIGISKVVLRANYLTALPADIFDDLTVTEIDLEGNLLESLPDGTFDGLVLQKLDLSGNRLTEMSAAILGDLEMAEDGNPRVLAQDPGDGPNVLDLTGNPLNTLGARTFSNLQYLDWLGARGNNLSSLPAGIFDGLTQLKTVDFTTAVGGSFELDMALASAKDDPAGNQFEITEGSPALVDFYWSPYTGSLFGLNFSEIGIDAGSTRSPVIAVGDNTRQVVVDGWKRDRISLRGVHYRTAQSYPVPGRSNVGGGQASPPVVTPAASLGGVVRSTDDGTFVDLTVTTSAALDDLLLIGHRFAAASGSDTDFGDGALGGGLIPVFAETTTGTAVIEVSEFVPTETGGTMCLVFSLVPANGANYTVGSASSVTVTLSGPVADESSEGDSEETTEE